MRAWRQFVGGVRTLWRRDRDDQEIAAEVEHYFEQAELAHRERGLTNEEARRAARRDCGDPESARERIRSYGWENWVEGAAQDLRYAGRQLGRNLSFTLASVLVLALGIGVGTAMFTVLDAVLLRPLPYPHPDRLVELSERGTVPARFPGVSGPDVRDWQQRSRSFTAIAYYKAQRKGLELPH
jgi:hypothetical protein